MKYKNITKTCRMMYKVLHFGEISKETNYSNTVISFLANFTKMQNLIHDSTGLSYVFIFQIFPIS